MAFPKIMRRVLRGRINAVALRLAGRAALADLEHVGRRSGLVRHTPVRAFRKGDTVVIGINFGPESDWLRNIQAAGTCRMRLGREQLELGSPRVVPLAQGARAMPWLFGVALRYVARTAECLELSVLESAPVPGPAGRPR